MALVLKETKKKYNFHLVNGYIFTRPVSDEEIQRIRKEWLISTVKKSGEIVVENFIVQAKDLILIGLDISEL
jgi:hypothetical protein